MRVVCAENPIRVDDVMEAPSSGSSFLARHHFNAVKTFILSEKRASRPLTECTWSRIPQGAMLMLPGVPC
jgi:hypothetical protein